MDLEEFRTSRDLSYRQLAKLIGETAPSKVWGWALGHIWPPAEKLETIFAASEGRVTLVGMHRRRLQWLRQNRAESVQDQTAAHVRSRSVNAA